MTFTEVAPSAARIVIGTVTNATAVDEEGEGYASVFRLSAEEVLRGVERPARPLTSARAQP